MDDLCVLFKDGPIEVRVTETTPDQYAASLLRVTRLLWLLEDQLRDEQRAATQQKEVK